MPERTIGPPPPGEITVLLNRVSAGEQEEYNRLAELVYAELRKIASHVMTSESRDHTLQPTMMATEAYFKLVDHGSHNWQNRAHFFAAAAEAMRHILIDNARKRNALRHGAGAAQVDLDSVDLAAASSDERLLAVHEALDGLAKHDPAKAELVKLRFFVGLTNEEAAKALGLSVPTAKRYWAYARAWLYREIQRQQAGR